LNERWILFLFIIIIFYSSKNIFKHTHSYLIGVYRTAQVPTRVRASAIHKFSLRTDRGRKDVTDDRYDAVVQLNRVKLYG
jgi:hypothetical protein